MRCGPCRNNAPLPQSPCVFGLPLVFIARGWHKASLLRQHPSPRNSAKHGPVVLKHTSHTLWGTFAGLMYTHSVFIRGRGKTHRSSHIERDMFHFRRGRLRGTTCQENCAGVGPLTRAPSL